MRVAGLGGVAVKVGDGGDVDGGGLGPASMCFVSRMRRAPNAVRRSSGLAMILHRTTGEIPTLLVGEYTLDITLYFALQYRVSYH